ncbi:hypothetical protein FKM82_013574 [Ascaphus truei]
MGLLNRMIDKKEFEYMDIKCPSVATSYSLPKVFKTRTFRRLNGISMYKDMLSPFTLVSSTLIVQRYTNTFYKVRSFDLRHNDFANQLLDLRI